MTPRERFVWYVRHGDARPFVSLQIGAGAGFDCKLAGKEWISEGTLADTIRAYELVECDALYNVGLPDLGAVLPALAWTSETTVKDDTRITQRRLATPYGELCVDLHERPRSGVTPTRYPLTVDDSLDAVCWMADQYFKAVPYVGELLAPLLKEAHPYGPVSVQWNIQPFELLGLASVPDLVLHAMTDPQRYRRVCDRIRNVNIELVRAVLASGADFIFLGGPGAEMMSPDLYEAFIVPDSHIISQAVHDAGGLIYSHICSPIEPFLSKGYFGEMGIDLFETLSGPPVGNVADLGAARLQLPAAMCTRGNVGLDVLLHGTLDDVEQATQAVLDATAGTKHMVAASDYLFYDIPLENVQAMVRTVRASA
ncbi:MAG: hypothetical protein JXA69_13040 [Phycisphaerae bacterium]|nr:hypothetical protein [Phycisphaerae bacterium]